MASQLTHNLNIDALAMPSRHPYDYVASTGGKGGFSDGVGRGLQEDEYRVRSNENMIGHGQGDVSFPFPDTGRNQSHHWLHYGRPGHPEDGFPLNFHGITRVPGSQGMASRSESDTYHHNDAASHGLQGDLLAGAP